MESWTFDGMATDHQTGEHYPYHLSIVYDPTTGGYSLGIDDPDGTRYAAIQAGGPDEAMISAFLSPRRTRREQATI